MTITALRWAAATLSVAAGLSSPWGASAATVLEVSSVEELRDAIALAPPRTTVRVAAGRYLVSEPIVIDRNNLIIEGAGVSTLFMLAPDANEPVFVLGDATLENLEGTPPRRNLTLRRFRVDGNRLEQNREPEGEVSDTPGLDFLRNNCVSLRQVTKVLLEDLRLSSCRSGGIVVGNRSRQVTIRRVKSFDHDFDGIAWDGDIRGSRIEDSSLHSNLAAGISFDLGVVNNRILNTVVRDNLRVGVFLSESSGNRFSNCVIERNGEDGVFIRDGEADDAASRDNIFRDCQILSNTRNGIWQAGVASTGNRVVRGSLLDNAAPFEESFPDQAPLIFEGEIDGL